ncbi:E3 ubiquitin-protein ligase PRT6 [Gracilariopsis chorda]|uniref:E3 ubiquitin-protein ligase n=1 Tax=Gracilariopsis chorda TaxID=448386 RepID=A0A2V3IP97_9FLOR|nr:E3 ubiquitin-protein ligase PRT6 [Gracilariopsis chorda]|eukprot:PXF43883.1 E3 ubiquitin-protein ligase PRT6 [Gracilariopsis chorda]
MDATANAFVEINGRVIRHARTLYAQLKAATRPPRPHAFEFEEGEVSLFVDYTLSNPEWETDTEVLKNMMSTVLVPSSWPLPGLPSLKQQAGDAAKSGVCGQVWRKDELAYKCRTCERDTSCVICVPCFRNGDHEGHDYAMLRINGGCCDCGDDQAWHPNGFCRHHKGASAEDEDLSSSLPPDLKRAIAESVMVVSELVCNSCTMLHKLRRSSRSIQHNRLRTRTCTLLEWLYEVVRCGDGIRRVVGLLLTSKNFSISRRSDKERQQRETAANETSGVSWLELMLRLDGVDMLPYQVLVKLHALYFQLITDTVFKRIFLEKFALNYPRYVHAHIALKYDSRNRSSEEDEDLIEKTDIISKFTVQLFTVPALVPIMLQDGGLLEVLIKLLGIIFESTSDPLDLYRRDVPFENTNYAWHCSRNNPAVDSTDLKTSGLSKTCLYSLESLERATNFPSVKWLVMRHARRTESPLYTTCDVKLTDETELQVRDIKGEYTAFSDEDIAFPVEVEYSQISSSDSYAPDVSGITGSPISSKLRQFSAFEEGLETFDLNINRLVSGLPKDTVFGSTVAEARALEDESRSGNESLVHPMRLNWSAGEVLLAKDTWWRIMADLNYILSHKEAAFHLVHVRVDLFRLFVRMISMLQGMHPLSRRLGDHVLMDQTFWTEGYRLEAEVYHLSELLVVGFCGEEVPDSFSAETKDKCTYDLRSSRQRAIGVLGRCLEDWIEREEAIEALSTYAGEYFSVAHAVSIHLPLHRLFALFVHHAIRLDNVDLRTILSGMRNNTPESIAQKLITHPIRIQAFLYQERARMWRRNGRMISLIPVYYRYPWYSEWYVDLDIFLQQCCAVIMGDREFVQVALRAFRIRGVGQLISFVKSYDESSSLSAEFLEDLIYVNGASGTGSYYRQGSLERNSLDRRYVSISAVDMATFSLAPRMFKKKDTANGPKLIWIRGDIVEDISRFGPVLLDGLMTYLVHITSERTLCGHSDENSLRRKFIHQLCSRDRTYSQLYKICSFRICNVLGRGSDTPTGPARTPGLLVERVIGSIAEYLEPKYMEQGKYRLKDDIWKEFDPFFPQYTPREKNDAEVRHASVSKRRKQQLMMITEEIISNRPTWQQFNGLKRLSLFLCSDHDLAIATRILKELAEIPHSQKMPATICATALHLVSANVESVRISNPPSNAMTWLLNCFRPEAFDPSVLGSICRLALRTVELQADFAPTFSRILCESYKRCPPGPKLFLQQRLPQCVASLCAKDGRLSQQEELVTAEDKRRRRLQEKKKEQQSAMLARMQSAQADFERHMSEAKDFKSDTVSHPYADKSTTNENQGADRNFRKGSFDILHRVQDSFRETPSEIPKCALCHEEGGAGSNGPLGCIGFKQMTKLPLISREQFESQFHVTRSHSTCDRVETPGNNVNTAGLPDFHRESAEAMPVPVSNFIDRHQRLVNLKLLEEGIETSTSMHVSLCGHLIHSDCFEGYFSNLISSRETNIPFEGNNVVNLENMEFLCPACRRLANLVLPCVDIPFDGLESKNEPRENTGTKDVDAEQLFWKWLDEAREKVLTGKHVAWKCENGSTLTGEIWNVSHDVFQLFLPTKDITAERNRLILKKGLYALPVSDLLGRFRLWTTDYVWLNRDGSFVSDVYCQPCTSLVLPSALIASVASAEIVARSYEWGGSLLLNTRRTLKKLFSATRAQFHLNDRNIQEDERKKALSGLWRIATQEAGVVKADPFAMLSYFCFMWPTSLTVDDLSFLIRLCYVHFSRVRKSMMGLRSSARSAELVLFLRRAAILFWCVSSSRDLQLSVYTESERTSKTLVQEIEGLVEYLNVPVIRSSWKKDCNYSAELQDVLLDENQIERSFGLRPSPVGLRKLPDIFQTLLERLARMPCDLCREVPRRPALCLVCHDMLCYRSEGNVGELLKHAETCGAGIGVFLLLKKAKVFVLRGNRSAVWGSPYLDAHGEEDEFLRRGTPLLLNRDRYSSLEQLWLCHGFDQDPRVLSKTLRTNISPLGTDFLALAMPPTL